jgi:glycosyltransferase involved in cell wall biosynthesis
MKVAVYTIALNEAAHVERWANSAADADYRIVADTGSTDDTVERLEAMGVIVHRIAVRPWRFDIARNAALALIPADVDICCNLDMDQFFEPGWRAALEEAWAPDTTAVWSRLEYRYSMDNPQVRLAFQLKKIHHRFGYRWSRPVHEHLVHSGEEVTRNCPNIVISEVQDRSKDTRGSYLPLMEIAHAENREDSQICFWLGREYMYHDRPADAAQLLERYLDLLSSTWHDERAEAMRYLARVQPERKMYWLDRARVEAPHRREIWLDLAEQFHSDSDWENLFWACANGIKKTRRTNSYLDEGLAWGARLHDLGAIAAWRLNMSELAVEWGMEALRLEPNNERLRKNLGFFEALVRQSGRAEA